MAGCFAGTIDAERLLGAVNQYETGCISRVIEEVFHADGAEREARRRKTQICIEMSGKSRKRNGSKRLAES